MTGVQVLLRMLLLTLAAAACVELTAVYVGSMRAVRPNPRREAMLRVRAPGPDIGRIPEFIGEGILFALVTVAGRVVFRLRLSAPPGNEGKMLSLELERRAAETGPGGGM